MRTSDPYTESVFDFLDKITSDQSYLIENLTKPETRPQFIEAVKLYIRSYYFGGGIEFNTDYTKIRRIDIPEQAWEDLFAFKRKNP